MSQLKFTASLSTIMILSLGLIACTSKDDSQAGANPPLPTPPTKVKTICTAKQSTNTQSPFEPIRSKFEKGEISRLCMQAIEVADQKIKTIPVIPEDQKNFNTTMLAFETAMAELSDTTTPLTFMGYVSKDETLRTEGSDCEMKVGSFHTDVFSRKKLYATLKTATAKNPAEERLLSETLKAFVKSGMNLDDQTLAKVKDLMEKLNSLQTEYQKNLNNDETTVTFSAEELKGVSDSFLTRLEKSSNGQYIVTTKSPDYVEVMSNAVKSETRHKMLQTYENRQADANTKLLEQAVTVRQQIAQLMGYKTWADYQLDGRMAKDVPTVMSFLNSLKQKLTLRNQADQNKFLKFKQQIDSTATKLDAWDLRFLDTQLKKQDYAIDEEKIREYFPATTVMKGLFDVYSNMLGVQFVKLDLTSVWSPDVQLYEIHNDSDCSLVGYFYTDLIPREGKYEHAAAFPLITGRVLADGKYSYPISAIVANLTPPSGNKPSLLTHDDVETIFHEFGHIMHQTLTKAAYASLSGSSTAQDFVEAPSQMLENWVWNAEILSSLSGHYLDSTKKLPNELLQQMIAARDFDQGYRYTRQLLFALFDMSLHSQPQGSVDATKIYNQMHQEIVGLPAVDGGHFAASFGHLMGGYDAGYYSYLWSEVYATDMFEKFRQAPKGLLDAQVGLKYRTEILEKGGMFNALDLLKSFLNREPSAEAFYKKLNIPN